MRVSSVMAGVAVTLMACGGPYAQKGRYAHEVTDQGALSAEANTDLAPVRSATDYDAITDFAVECVLQTTTAERLASELVAMPSDAYGAREAQKKRTQDAATRCLTACPRVQNATTASARDQALGTKYGPRCESGFGHGALQLADGERALDRTNKLLAEKSFLEARESVLEIESCLKALGGESSTRQSELAKKLMSIRSQNAGVLLKAESFARDPWVVATRGRLRAIASERRGKALDAAHTAALDEEEADLSKQLFERRQLAGI